MKEEFLEILQRQYTQSLHEAMVECTHRDQFDADSFALKARKIWKSAKVDGLTTEHFHEILQDVAPDHAHRVELA